MNDSETNDELQISTDANTKAQHLILIVNESANGHDIIESPSSEGGLRLNSDEDDVIDLAVLIEEQIVPLHYQGDWGRFLIDLLRVIQNAQEDGTGDLMDDIQYFLNSIIDEGKVMVA